MGKRSVLASSVVVVVAALVAVVAVLVGPAGPAEAAFPAKNGAIAFSSYEGSAGDGFQVWRVNPNGSGKTMLTDFPSDNHNLNPAWSADGERIAFDSCKPLPPPDGIYCTNDVWVMGADGSDPVKVTPEGQLDAPFGPSWFPSGNTIAYSAVPPNANGEADIFALKFGASGNTVSLTNLTNTPDVGESSPAVSPDGERIAFTSYRGDRGGDTEVYVMGAAGLSAGERPVRITDNAVWDEAPDWSPDGKRIAFASRLISADGSPNSEIFTKNADGTAKARLTRNTGTDEHPAFSPNGRRIAFVSDRDGSYGIWKMGADGSNPTLIPGSSRGSFLPDWQPLP